MLFTTIVMLLLTLTVYIYENKIVIPQIKQPTIAIDSQKFGKIKKIAWLSEYISDKNALIILSSRKVDNIDSSYLYYLDIDTGKSNLLAQFPSHKNLDNVILFEPFSTESGIITAYDKGIVKIPFHSLEDTVSAYSRLIEIEGFSEATSMDFKDNLIFTLANDNLLYLKNLQETSFMNFTNVNQQPDMTTYYVKPYYIVNLNAIDNIITYAAVNKNRVDLYAMKDGIPVTWFDKPVIKNVITASKIQDGDGFIGMNISEDSKDNKNLNVFMIRRTIDKYNNDDFYKLDTVPYNLDPFGGVPAIDSATYNDKYTLAYTSYDENHKGSLKLCGLNQKPKVILSNENIFGPISITEKHVGDVDKDSILYYTYENNSVRIKICNSDGKLIADVTDMIMKVEK